MDWAQVLAGAVTELTSDIVGAMLPHGILRMVLAVVLLAIGVKLWWATA